PADILGLFGAGLKPEHQERQSVTTLAQLGWRPFDDAEAHGRCKYAATATRRYRAHFASSRTQSYGHARKKLSLIVASCPWILACCAPTRWPICWNAMGPPSCPESAVPTASITCYASFSAIPWRVYPSTD